MGRNCFKQRMGRGAGGLGSYTRQERKRGRYSPFLSAIDLASGVGCRHRALGHDRDQIGAVV